MCFHLALLDMYVQGCVLWVSYDDNCCKYSQLHGHFHLLLVRRSQGSEANLGGHVFNFMQNFKDSFLCSRQNRSQLLASGFGQGEGLDDAGAWERRAFTPGKSPGGVTSFSQKLLEG